jgi:small subunit ribosomal protein S2e
MPPKAKEASDEKGAKPAGKGGFGRGERGERGDRGDRRGRGRGRRGARRGRDDGAKEWVPATKLGRLVKEGKIKSLEEIYLFSLPIKESQIIDQFLGESLKDEVMKIMPVQKQSAAGQRTRFKAFVIVGDKNGHCGLGVKCAKEVALAIRGAIVAAKLTIVPIRRGFWGSTFGTPHTVACKIHGKCGSVHFRLIPAPRGTGIVAAKAPKKLLEFAGVQDCYSSARGHTRTLGNFIGATFDALQNTYNYLTPDLWTPTTFTKSPYQEFTDFLRDTKGQAQKAKAKAASHGER